MPWGSRRWALLRASTTDSRQWNSFLPRETRPMSRREAECARGRVECTGTHNNRSRSGVDAIFTATFLPPGSMRSRAGKDCLDPGDALLEARLQPFAVARRQGETSDQAWQHRQLIWVGSFGGRPASERAGGLRPSQAGPPPQDRGELRPLQAGLLRSLLRAPLTSRCQRSPRGGHSSHGSHPDH